MQGFTTICGQIRKAKVVVVVDSSVWKSGNLNRRFAPVASLGIIVVQFGVGIGVAVGVTVGVVVDGAVIVTPLVLIAVVAANVDPAVIVVPVVAVVHTMSNDRSLAGKFLLAPNVRSPTWTDRSGRAQ